ncbi:MAG: hypothetical protein Q9167_002738 [Letrouitia subvulpina]
MSMSSPQSLKRTYEDAGLDNAVSTRSQTTTIAETSQPETMPPAPPAHFDPTAASTIQIAPHLITSTPPSSVCPMESPNVISWSDNSGKRTKLTAAEKETKRLEKEARDSVKAEQKAKKEEEKARKEEQKAKREEEKSRREEEKAKKDEEKRAKDVEKEEKRRAKEEQNKIKEEDRKKREDEKNKKERSQLRLSSFFARPEQASDISVGPSILEGASPSSSRRSSIDCSNGLNPGLEPRSASATPQKRQESLYERTFPPFFVHAHTMVAPTNRFTRDDESSIFARHKLDESLTLSKESSNGQPPGFDPQKLLHISPYKRRKLYQFQFSVKDVAKRFHSTTQNQASSTESKLSKKNRTPIDQLKLISTRYLKFVEDVRPPYIGTYTKLQDNQKAAKLCRNPFSRNLPNTDYDYDSEAEWEDPGEGEDLDSEGEEENESEEGDDMDDFLDDEDAGDGSRQPAKRRPMIADLEPTSTGLCWENDFSANAKIDLGQYKLEVILESSKLPIDPYSTAYWTTSKLVQPSANSASRFPSTAMDLSRIPLNAINRNHIIVPSPLATADNLKPSLILTGPQPNAAKARKIIPAEVLHDFKRAVEGSDLTKAGLIEVLKKQFPKQSKDAIKDTLNIIAERVGQKEKDKRWVIKN